MKIELKILDDRVKIEDLQPKTAGSAGIDLMAVSFKDCIDGDMDVLYCGVGIAPGEVKLIGTGLAINIKDPGYAAMILPRSGLGHKGLVLGNLVGLVDADFTGEIKISAWNRSDETIFIERMNRIAQLVIVPVIRPEFQIVESFAASGRGDGSFGSTGV